MIHVPDPILTSYLRSRFDTRVFWGIPDKSTSGEPLMPDDEPEPVVDEEDNSAGLFNLIQSRAEQLKEDQQKKKKWF